MKICRCCGRSMESSEMKCTRCGCQYVNTLDDDAENREIQRCRDMRNKIILPKITEIAVNAYEYQLRGADGGLESKGRKKIILADGVMCSDRIYWSPVSFGQWLYSEEAQDLELSYKYAGKEYIIYAKIKPIKCDDYWRVGLYIDAKLNLWIYVGTDKKYSKAGPYEITLA